MARRRWLAMFVVVGQACACGHAAPPPETAKAPDTVPDASSPAVDASPGPSSVAAADAAAPSTASPASASAAAAHAPGPIFESTGSSYPAATLHDVFEKSEPKLLACFLPAHKRDATLRGHVNIKFTINGDGKPGGVQDQGSNLPDPRVVACVVKAVKTLRFTKPEGSVTVTYPIIFHASEPFILLPEPLPPAP